MSRSLAIDELTIGASLGCFRGLTLEKAMNAYLKLSKDFNLKAVELLFEKETGRPSLWHWEIDSSVRSFLEKFEFAGVHLPFVYINPISPNPRIREESIRQLKEAMEKAAELNMEYAVMHARGLALGLSDEEQFDEWLKLIGELTDYAKENAIILTIENADFLWNLADVAETVKRINSKWLRMTFDIGHANLRKVSPLQTFPVRELFLRMLDAFLPFSFSLFRRNMPYEKYGSIKKFLKTEKDLIHVVHIHDYNGRRDHLGIGEGKIDFSFLPLLKEFFRGPYIFEVEFNNPIDFEKSYKEFLKRFQS
jgi:sugar phosphate isomerase/epimerase